MRVEESPDTVGQDAPAREAAKADGKWHRKQTACVTAPEVTQVRVKRWGKSPPATAATRRLAKPRPVQGEQAPPRRPAEELGSCTDGWSPSTESGLQACYREAPAAVLLHGPGRRAAAWKHRWQGAAAPRVSGGVHQLDFDHR